MPEILFATLLGVFGLFMAVRSLGYGLFARGGLIGPGFVPFAAGVLVAGFATWAGVEGALRARGNGSGGHAGVAQAGKPPQGQSDPAGRPRPEPDADSGPGAEADHAARRKAGGRLGSDRRAMVVLGLVAAAALLTYFIGYVIAFGIITFVMLAVVERERVWLGALISLAAIFVAWLLFAVLLGVPLPGGMLHILGGG
ncbi:MAG: tripartite tricarboxylate transporter TctB family protein [Streptosporangiaceae bacterium]